MTPDAQAAFERHVTALRAKAEAANEKLSRSNYDSGWKRGEAMAYNDAADMLEAARGELLAGRASLVDASETQLTKAAFHGAAEWNLTKPRGEQFRERLRCLGLRLVVDGEAKG
jgi:hypothetical protein